MIPVLTNTQSKNRIAYLKKLGYDIKQVRLKNYIYVIKRPRLPQRYKRLSANRKMYVVDHT